MNTSRILDDQVIHVKRGRSNGLGFEPAFNSYFDFYLNSKYFEEPLLELEDVTFHLFLRKNLNDRNKNWKMPTIRQMKKRFKIGHHKIDAMMARLEAAHLLKKQSGVRTGGVNVTNVYVLSDPIPTLEEFLEVAEEGLFGQKLKEEWCPQNEDMGCPQNEDMDDLKMRTPDDLKTRTDQQTLKNKQTVENKVDPVFEDLKFQIGEKTFNRFMKDAQLVSIENGMATIGTPQSYARDWIENRLSDKLKRSLGVDAVRCVVLEESIA